MMFICCNTDLTRWLVMTMSKYNDDRDDDAFTNYCNYLQNFEIRMISRHNEEATPSTNSRRPRPVSRLSMATQLGASNQTDLQSRLSDIERKIAILEHVC